MEEIIRQKLIEVEQKEHVKILLAVESGSRAWGFSSPDSDYDVRFLYIHPTRFYCKLEKTKDVMDVVLNDLLDINGWDLNKALRLLHASNPTLFEWFHSPIVYESHPFFERIRKVSDDYFSCKAGGFHYLNIARQTYEKHLKNEQVVLKKYFYVLRPLLACRWILERQTPPPMLFQELVQAQLPKEQLSVVNQLVSAKRNAPEQGTVPHILQLDEWIEREIPAIEAKLQALPKEEDKGWGQLNQLFLDTLQTLW